MRPAIFRGAVNFPQGLLEFKLSGATDFDQLDLSVLLYCKMSGQELFGQLIG